MVKWPGVIEAGTENDIPINGVDLMPTFAELASVPVPKSQPVDGTSIVPLLKGEDEKFDKDRSIFFHFPLYLGGSREDRALPVYNGQDNYWRAVPLSVIIKGDYKLIHYYEYDNKVELFNLHEDISEQQDLSDEKPEITNDLQEELMHWIEDVNAPVPNISNPRFSP